MRNLLHKQSLPAYRSSWMLALLWLEMLTIILAIGIAYKLLLPKVHAATLPKVSGVSASFTQLQPEPTEAQVIYSATHADTILRIWTLESSRGSNGRIECERKHMVNNLGFDVADHRCFDNYSEEVQTVENWLNDHLNAHPLANTLCIYNRGIDESDCQYARDFMGI